MAKGYKIELLASRYSISGSILEKGFTTTIRADSPQLIMFQNSSFKITNEEIPDEAVVIPVETVAGGIPLSEIAGISKKVLESLAAAGITTAQQIVSDTLNFDDLLAIEGIGESTANKVIELANEAIDNVE